MPSPASATATKPNIECHNIARFFPPSTWALKNATLSIHEGESSGHYWRLRKRKIYAPLYHWATRLSPPKDELKNIGPNMGTASDAERTVGAREHIAFVFQAYHLIAHLNATESIAHTLRMRGVPGRQARQRALQALEQVGLGHRLEVLPRNMSGGEQQRVAVARALACAPRILLCDEPTGNLDTENSHKVLDLLLAGRAEKQSLVIITHEPDIAARCDRQLHMVDGMLVSPELTRPEESAYQSLKEPVVRGG